MTFFDTRPRSIAFWTTAALSLCAFVMGCSGADDNTTAASSTTATTTATGGAGSGGDATSSGNGGMGGSASSTGAGGLGGDATGGAGGDASGGAGGAGGAEGGAPPVPLQSVWLWAEQENNAGELGFLGHPDGSYQTIATLPVPWDDIHGFAVSPNGQWMVVTHDPPGNTIPNILELYAVDGSVPPVTLYSSDNGIADRLKNVTFSPDGTLIAFTQAGQLFVIPTVGGPAVALSPPADTWFVGVESFYRWAPQSSPAAGQIAYRSETWSPTIADMYVVDAMAANPMPVKLSAATTNTQEVAADHPEWDAQGRVYYRSDELQDGVNLLYRGSLTSPGAVVPGTTLSWVDGVLTGPSSVSAVAVSADGMQLAFAADSPTQGLGQVFVKGVDSGTADLVSNVQTTSFGGTYGPVHLEFFPDGSRLLAQADWDPDNASYGDPSSVYILPIMPPAGGVRILREPGFGPLGNFRVAISADGQRIWALGNFVEMSGNSHIGSTTDFTTPDQLPSSWIDYAAVPNGRIDGYQLAD